MKRFTQQDEDNQKKSPKEKIFKEREESLFNVNCKN